MIFLKHFIALLLFSFAVIFGTHHVHPLIVALVSAHDWIAQVLLQIFSGGEAGNIIRQLIAMLAVPLLVAFIPTVIFWLAKRRLFPYFMHVVWVVWLLQTTAMIMMYKVPMPA